MIIVASDGSFYCGLVGNADNYGSYQIIIRPTMEATQSGAQLTGCTCGTKNNVHIPGCALWLDLSVHASN